jgi:hypothetical protein
VLAPDRQGLRTSLLHPADLEQVSYQSISCQGIVISTAASMGRPYTQECK